MIINFLLLIRYNYFLNYFMTYIPVYTFYNLSKSVRPFAFDNFSKMMVLSAHLIETLQRHWATRSLIPFFSLSLCYLRMRNGS